jgi:aryl-alcohol dehydrogenase-like predicted oxidoreductase
LRLSRYALHVLGDQKALIAIGAMRLSTEPDRDEQRAVATLHAAFNEGLTLIDTADAYAHDTRDMGHNERLIARALASWPGDRDRIIVITKGGLTRPGGRWTPDGRARSLRAACAASRDALGLRRLPLYQLHAPDPRVDWGTSVRALAGLQSGGAIDAVGLCNVTVEQIGAARSILSIATVQAELSPWKDRLIASGVIDYCHAHDIMLLAFRPFGGVVGRRRIARDDVVGEIAGARGVSPFAIVLAWMRGLAPWIVPLPGPTREETARDSVRAQTLALSDAEQTALDRYFPTGRIRTQQPRAARSSRVGGGVDHDVVMVMGLPGAGKSRLAADLVTSGYARLNRDESGGPLAALVPKLEMLFQRGASRIVLDNTYLSRASRAAVLDLAAAYKRRVRGRWLDISVEDAQVNIVRRMIRVHGRLLTSDELATGGGPDRLSPSALFRAHRQVELPDAAEGFAELDIVPFVRREEVTGDDRAVILWCDGVVRPRDRAMAVFEEAVLAGRRTRLARYRADGWGVHVLSWEPQVAERGVSVEHVEADFRLIRDRLGMDLGFSYCPHGGGPPVCWCRKPLPGLGVLLLERHHLRPDRCIYVGVTTQDELFARRLGMPYQHVGSFFG